MDATPMLAIAGETQQLSGHQQFKPLLYAERFKKHIYRQYFHAHQAIVPTRPGEGIAPTHDERKKTADIDDSWRVNSNLNGSVRPLPDDLASF
jgi:hypothetical protein